MEAEFLKQYSMEYVSSQYNFDIKLNKKDFRLGVMWLIARSSDGFLWFLAGDWRKYSRIIEGFHVVPSSSLL
jgi:hypothetical protein